MPNHVYNNVIFNGTWDELILLKTVLAEPTPIQLSKVDDDCPIFNFHSVITPDEEYWAEYNGPEPKYADFLERLKSATNHWYDWNSRNWGTKWNAYECFYHDNLNDDKAESYFLNYAFNTAWSQPKGVIRNLPKLLRELGINSTFTWHYEEEQGWGGLYEGNNDEITEVKSWDIPNSHSDYVDRDNVESCMCRWADDEDDWFSDCPRPIEVTEQEKESKEQ